MSARIFEKARCVLVVESLVNGIYVHVCGVMDQAVQLPPGNIRNLLCCPLRRPCHQLGGRTEIRGVRWVLAYFKRAVVGYVTCDYMDVLKVRYSILQVRGS